MLQKIGYKKIAHIKVPDVEISLSEMKSVVTMKGMKSDIEKAKLQLFDMKNNFVCFVIEGMSSQEKELLMKQETINYVKERLRKENVGDVEWSIRNGQYLVVCCPASNDIEYCINIFKMSVVMSVISLRGHSNPLSEFELWKNKVQELYAMYDGKMTINVEEHAFVQLCSTNDKSQPLVEDITSVIQSCKKQSDIKDVVVSSESYASFREKTEKSKLQYEKFQNQSKNMERLKVWQDQRGFTGTREVDTHHTKSKQSHQSSSLSDDYSVDTSKLYEGHPILEQKRQVLFDELTKVKEHPTKSDAEENVLKFTQARSGWETFSEKKQIDSSTAADVLLHEDQHQSLPVDFNSDYNLDILQLHEGDQPPGTMTTTVLSSDCAGYKNCGTIEIKYRFPDGHQGGEHPCPGRKYAGTLRTAYLPNNAEGREIAKLLRVAFDRRLVFTIGTSLTTGLDGVIIWNGIAHKTVLTPNSEFGYPDPEYLDVVKTQLAAKGITEKDIDNNHF